MLAIIPNSGLDNFCTSMYPMQNFTYAAVGTGTTPKDVTSSSLTSEIARVDVGSAGSIDIRSAQPVGSNLVWTYQTAHIFNFGSAQNLTEYAYFQGWTGATAIELFRDLDGNAVTVSIPAGGQLRLNLTFTCSVPLWGVQNTTVQVDGVGAIQARHTLFCGSANDYQNAFFKVWPGAGVYPWTGSVLKQAVNPDVAANPSAAVGSEQYRGSRPYQGGTFKRQAVLNFEPNAYAGPVCGAVWGDSNGYYGGGYLVTFDNPASFQKTDTQRLTLTFEFSVERA